MQETKEIWVQFLGGEDSLEENMAIHFNILAWKIPWTEEPNGLQSIASQGIGHDWSNWASMQQLTNKREERKMNNKRRYGIRIIKLRLENMRIICFPFHLYAFFLWIYHPPCSHIIYSDLNDNIYTKCFLSLSFITLRQATIKNNNKNVTYWICMEIQKTSNSQSNLEKEEWNWRNQPAWLQTLLQSHSHQDSMVLVQRQKYRSMEQNRKPRDKSMNLWSPYLWQRRQGYTMEKR